VLKSEHAADHHQARQLQRSLSAMAPIERPVRDRADQRERDLSGFRADEIH
jgi:hypothetical protein